MAGVATTQNLGIQVPALWEQTNYEVGFRAYASKSWLNPFIELNYLHTKFEERIEPEDPLLSFFRSSYEGSSDGFSLGAGLTLRISFLTVDGLISYQRALHKNDYVTDEINVGGYVYTIGVGIGNLLKN